MQNHLRRKCNQSICSAAEPVSPRRTKGASRREAAVPPIVPLSSAGRGGSVSRRDHSPAARNRAHLAWAYKSEGTHKPIPSHSSGEGVWGRGASLREAASPPASPQNVIFSGGSARRGKDSHSRQWRLSMAVFLNRNKRPLAAPIEVAEPFSERPPPSQYAKPWQVAAALSAAVTTTKLIGDAPNSQAESTPKKRSNPNASCSSEEEVWGRGASLREAASPPESPLPSALTWIYQIKC